MNNRWFVGDLHHLTSIPFANCFLFSKTLLCMPKQKCYRINVLTISSCVSSFDVDCTSNKSNKSSLARLQFKQLNDFFVSSFFVFRSESVSWVRDGGLAYGKTVVSKKCTRPVGDQQNTTSANFTRCRRHLSKFIAAINSANTDRLTVTCTPSTSSYTQSEPFTVVNSNNLIKRSNSVLSYRHQPPRETIDSGVFTIQYRNILQQVDDPGKRHRKHLRC